ncbi:MAG: AMP-binding protein [Agathobacter sp.]|nr:AMP-binding protein [Agathobacter sp.]
MMNVLDYLENAAKVNPDRIALEDGNGKLTYREYRDLARKVGLFLMEKGYHNTNKPIGVVAGRDKYTLILFMGTLYSGNFYVPVDPELKEEKKNHIIEQSGMELLLSIEDISEVLTEDGISEEALEYAYDADAQDQALYLIFTSGSTGVPKGGLKTHGAMIDYVEAFSATYPYAEHEILGNQTPFFFDASAKDIYLCLKNRATMQIIPTSLFSMPVKLVEYLNEKQVGTISWVPSALSLLTQLNVFADIKPTTLKNVFFVGEVFPMKQLNKWRKEMPDLTYVNLYGSSEIAGICLYYEVKKEDVFADTESLPMGKPLSNCKIVLVEQETGKVITEQKVSGEIYLSSKALAKEYYGDKEKTENSFVTVDLDGTGERRYFKTGDIAFYNENGDLVFTSRKDFQIKHMGHRIELGEIEVAALSLDGIEKCGCIYDSDKKRIVLYCECAPDSELAGPQIKAALTEKLSSYMVPNRIVLIDKVPLNANGKIDRVELKRIYSAK